MLFIFNRNRQNIYITFSIKTSCVSTIYNSPCNSSISSTKTRSLITAFSAYKPTIREIAQFRVCTKISLLFSPLSSLFSLLLSIVTCAIVIVFMRAFCFCLFALALHLFSFGIQKISSTIQMSVHMCTHTHTHTRKAKA